MRLRFLEQDVSRMLNYGRLSVRCEGSRLMSTSAREPKDVVGCDSASSSAVSRDR